MFMTKLPLATQTLVNTDAENRCTDRGDRLARYSAYYMWQVINRHDERLAAPHLARPHALRCSDMQHLATHLVHVRMVSNDYLCSLPESVRQGREQDALRAMAAGWPDHVQHLLDIKLLDTPAH